MSDGPNTATKSGAPDPLLGRVIAGRFRITDLIARGGMGKVYRAEQAPLGRLCALKVLHPNYMGEADPEFNRRFFREASVASKITHPNSVTIFDYGKTDDDVFYMAMEYLEGQTLHQALRRVRTMPEERVVKIAQQVCRALREAHALEVIHRDLKPANIFLTRHGDDEDFVKVLDFGLVKHISERPEEQLTQTGLFMGSPKYMAPEQIQGESVDPRTDVYSLGIIMYEMLAGKVPFERATSVNILMAHVGDPPPPMREVNPEMVCSPGFEELVMRCIAKDPRDRFSSMDELLQAIKHVHGVTMTGQLAAVSGAYAPGSIPPPPVRSSVPSISASGVISTPPPGLNPSDTVDAIEAPPRSRGWIVIGVVAAAALGGLVGLAAVQMDGKDAHPSPAASAVVPAVSVESLATVSGTSPSPTTAGTTVLAGYVLHVTSEPSGATVKESGVDLCPSTPCDVTFKDETPRVHKLVVSKAGYRAEAHDAKSTDGALTVKLSRLGAGRPAAPATKPAAEPTTPNGFKDLPY